MGPRAWAQDNRENGLVPALWVIVERRGVVGQPWELIVAREADGVHSKSSSSLVSVSAGLGKPLYAVFWGLRARTRAWAVVTVAARTAGCREQRLVGGRGGGTVQGLSDMECKCKARTHAHGSE